MSTQGHNQLDHYLATFYRAFDASLILRMDGARLEPFHMSVGRATNRAQNAVADEYALNGVSPRCAKVMAQDLVNDHADVTAWIAGG